VAAAVDMHYVRVGVAGKAGTAEEGIVAVEGHREQDVVVGIAGVAGQPIAGKTGVRVYCYSVSPRYCRPFSAKTTAENTRKTDTAY
jgi:hypothetical protein